MIYFEFGNKCMALTKQFTASSDNTNFGENNAPTISHTQAHMALNQTSSSKAEARCFASMVGARTLH